VARGLYDSFDLNLYFYRIFRLCGTIFFLICIVENLKGVLGGIVCLFGGCPGCLAGGGDPNFAIRGCCQRKTYTACVECAEIDKCKTAKGRVQQEELKRIIDMGVERWADEMQRKSMLALRISVFEELGRPMRRQIFPTLL
jgi:hypothetical protein